MQLDLIASLPSKGNILLAASLHGDCMLLAWLRLPRLLRNNSGRHGLSILIVFVSTLEAGMGEAEASTSCWLKSLRTEGSTKWTCNSAAVSGVPGPFQVMYQPWAPEWIWELAWTPHFPPWTALVDVYHPFLLSFNFFWVSPREVHACPYPHTCASWGALGLPSKATSQMLKVVGRVWHLGWGHWDFRVFSSPVITGEWLSSLL